MLHLQTKVTYRGCNVTVSFSYINEIREDGECKGSKMAKCLYEHIYYK
jgi:hypothetical protein